MSLEAAEEAKGDSNPDLNGDTADDVEVMLKIFLISSSKMSQTGFKWLCCTRWYVYIYMITHYKQVKLEIKIYFRK